MAQNDLLKKYLDTGVAFTQLTQQRAEDIVRDLVKAGEVKKGQSQKRVEELLERSRQSTEGMLDLVQAEVRNQVSKLGLVPKTELDALRRELAALKAQGMAALKKVPAKKAPATKAPVKNTVVKKAPVKKAPVKKAPVKKVVVKKVVVKKVAAKKVAAPAPTPPTPPPPPAS